MFPVGRVVQEIPDRISGITRVEAIVVDDGSTDRTAEVAGRAGAHVVNPW